MSEMSPAEEVFFAALEKAIPAEQAAYLDEACAGNPALRARVEKLLAAHPRVGGFLESEPVTTGDVTGTYSGAKSAVSDVPNAVAGTIVAGKYKLLQQIGEGGMGSVWMADQTEPVKRRVAVKLIRVDRGSPKTILSRFEAERQAIALMDHPHIAKLLDAGTTDTGQPYFVMELVKGIPLTDYCDAHKLSIPDRLNLFMQICSAVQHAHQKGIIHRDLKPTNILVESHDDKPVPKVIDFGLAKATSGMQLTEQTLFTVFGTVMGTPLYMAPEQAKFNAVDVDTRADLFALGVILYELLTGTTPIARDSLKKAALDEMLKLIREQEAPTPSSRLSSADNSPNVAANRQMEPIKLGRFVKGELDWIVMKSLSKERDRRYETANGFARDIERFLNHEAVQAGPPSASYRLRKFVRRNRGPVVAVGLVLLTLIVGIAGTTLGLIEARRQAEAKERALVAETLALVAEQEQRRIAEANEAQANLATAAEQAAKEREADQRARAEAAYARTADVLDAMTSEVTGDSLETQKALSEEQKKFFTGVLTYYKEFAATKGNDEQTRKRTAIAAYRVGLIESRLGRKKESATAYRMARDLFEKLAADFPNVPEYRDGLAGSHISLGVPLHDLGQVAEAEEQFQKALTIWEKLAAEFPNVLKYRTALATGHQNLCSLLARKGQVAEAKEQYQKALTISEKLTVEFPNVPEYREGLAMSHHSLGILLAGQGQREEANELSQKAQDILEKLVEEFPNVPKYRNDLALCHNNLGGLLADLGQPAEAKEQFQKALTIWEKLVVQFPNVPEHRNDLAMSHLNLGNLLKDQGQQVEAKEHYQKAITFEVRLVAEFPNVPEYRNSLAESHYNLGLLLAGQGHRAEAKEQFQKALDIWDKLAAEFPNATQPRKDLMAWSLYSLGLLLAGQGQWVEANKQFQKALDILEKLVAEFPKVPKYRNDLAMSHTNLGLRLAGQGQRAEANEYFQKALTNSEKLAAEFPNVPEYLVNLGGSYCNLGLLVYEWGKPADSLAWFDKAIRTLTPIHERDSRNVTARLFLRNSYQDRAMAFDRLQKYADAVKDWDRAVELSAGAEQQRFRASRATSRANVGQVAEAVAEVAELTKLPAWNVGQWYDFACVYGIASGKIADQKKEYADKAMELLQKAVKAGWKDAANMKRDTDLDSLRDRPDFKALVAELEKKFPPPPERGPPPREKK